MFNNFVPGQPGQVMQQGGFTNGSFGTFGSFGNIQQTNPMPMAPQNAPTLQQIQQALMQQIIAIVNQTANTNIDMIVAVNRQLMANGCQNQLMNALVSVGAAYIDYGVRNNNAPVQKLIVDVANILHGSLVANERNNYRHMLHLYDPNFLANLDACQREYMTIANTVQNIATLQQQSANPYGQQNNYQQADSSLGGGYTQQFNQPAPGVVLLSDGNETQTNAPRAASTFDGTPRIAGMPNIGTIPTRQIRNADGSIEDFHSATEAAVAPVQQQQYVEDRAWAESNFGTNVTAPPSNSYQVNGQTLLRDTTPQVNVMMQEQDNGEEVPITFKAPVYKDVPQTKNAADLLFENVFGDNVAAPQSKGAMPTAGWEGFGVGGKEWEPDPDAMAAAGIIRRGNATSGIHTSPLDEAEDAFIAEHYPDMHANNSIAAMDGISANAKEMYPNTHELSLMELTGNRDHMPQPNVGNSTMKTDANVVDLATAEPAEKAAVLGNKTNRSIAPVYIAGRSRAVLIRSLGGGKISVEAKAGMDYKIHETEVLAPTHNPITGQAGNPAIAENALLLASEKQTEQHFKKLLEEKTKGGEDTTDLLADGPMVTMAHLVPVSSVDRYAAAAHAELSARLGDSASNLSYDASINFNAFNSGSYLLSDDTLTMAIAITRAKTASTISHRAIEFFEDSNLPQREIQRLHKAMTHEVNRLLQITFHPDYAVDSFCRDVDDISTLLHENGEENVRDTLASIYSQAAKTVFGVYTAQALRKRLADVEGETGLKEDSDDAVFAEITNVTLLPFKYADYPLAFEGSYGRVTKDTLPKLYEVLNGILTARHQEGVYKYMVITEDYKIIEFFKPILAEDESIYIARG